MLTTGEGVHPTWNRKRRSHLLCAAPQSSKAQLWTGRQSNTPQPMTRLVREPTQLKRRKQYDRKRHPAHPAIPHHMPPASTHAPRQRCSPCTERPSTCGPDSLPKPKDDLESAARSKADPGPNPAAEPGPRTLWVLPPVLPAYGPAGLLPKCPDGLCTDPPPALAPGKLWWAVDMAWW